MTEDYKYVPGSDINVVVNSPDDFPPGSPHHTFVTNRIARNYRHGVIATIEEDEVVHKLYKYLGQPGGIFSPLARREIAIAQAIKEEKEEEEARKAARSIPGDFEKKTIIEATAEDDAAPEGDSTPEKHEHRSAWERWTISARVVSHLPLATKPSSTNTACLPSASQAQLTYLLQAGDKIVMTFADLVHRLGKEIASSIKMNASALRVNRYVKYIGTKYNGVKRVCQQYTFDMYSATDRRTGGRITRVVRKLGWPTHANPTPHVASHHIHNGNGLAGSRLASGPTPSKEIHMTDAEPSRHEKKSTNINHAAPTNIVAAADDDYSDFPTHNTPTAMLEEARKGDDSKAEIQTDPSKVVDENCENREDSQTSANEVESSFYDQDSGEGFHFQFPDEDEESTDKVEQSSDSKDKSVVSSALPALTQQTSNLDEEAAAIIEVTSSPYRVQPSLGNSLSSLIIDDDEEEQASIQFKTSKPRVDFEVDPGKAAREAALAADKEEVPEVPSRSALQEDWYPLSTPMPDDVEAKINVVLKGKRNSAAVVGKSAKGNDLLERDLATLAPGVWLNDECINAYLEHIVNFSNYVGGASKKLGGPVKDTPNVHAFNSFFFKNLSEQGVKSVERWSRRAKIDGVKLLGVDLILIPVHHGAHWMLMVVSGTEKTIEFFDSMRHDNSGHIEHAKKWLAHELGNLYVEEEWTVLDTESPQQTNGNDCGVFLCTNAQMLAMRCDPMASFSSKDIPMQRRRMAGVLLEGGFQGVFDLEGEHCMREAARRV